MIFNPHTFLAHFFHQNLLGHITHVKLSVVFRCDKENSCEVLCTSVNTSKDVSLEKLFPFPTKGNI